MTDHSPEAHAVGKALFEANCQELGADRDVIDTEWAIPAMRKFWLGQAQIALDALALHHLEVG